MQVSWAHVICKHTGKNVLILAPLAVSKQTIREALKFKIIVNPIRSSDDIKPGINIANYEMLHHFDPDDFAGIVLDEASIIKSYSGATRNAIIEFSKNVNYRLACTATPSPNDYIELGNHAEFLGIMSYNEMLATFFIHDVDSSGAKWRLKGHAEKPFWKWLASWGIFLTKPGDLNYSNEGFDLPELITKQHVVKSPVQKGFLLATEARSLDERRKARKSTIDLRIDKCVEIVNASKKPFLIWCGLNEESTKLKQSIPGAVEVTGSDTDEHKEKSMLDFAEGKIDVLISKPSICGFGMNFQVCSNTAFVGISDSFEALFQATKRFHRHGQLNKVTRHLIISESEGTVLANVQRKEREFEVMINTMVEHTKIMTLKNVRNLENEKDDYCADKIMKKPNWLIEGGY
jgi:superfamily II DNA or RNA helicase